jgi:mannose-6-phosphate isomerase-like protein (cupin superfamily)
MRNGIVVADLTEPSEVYGVHGSAGLSRWKCLARGAGLFGSWEAVEWAWIPVGGVSGEHLHTRTEEIYFILSGRGQITLNSRPHQVQAGDLILTTVGTTHGLRNTGTEGLGWLVIELVSPATARALHHPRPGARAAAGQDQNGIRNTGQRNSAVINLRTVGQIDPGRWLTGPVQTIQLVSLGRGEQVEIAAEDAEHTLFTLHGTGTLTRAEHTVALGPDVAVTLPLGTRVRVDGGPAGLGYFQASLEVPPDSRRSSGDGRKGGAR